MSPETRNLDGKARPVTHCLDDCGTPVAPGRLRCDACLDAARQAIAEARGRTVLPSDIAAVRARMG